MSQVRPGDNRTRRERSAARRLALLAIAGLAWAACMAGVLRSEVLARRESKDVRALVESARLTREHASVRYVIRSGDAVLGALSCAVSGSREEEQLAHVIDGELHAPLPVRVRGIVVATWDRKPERLVLDVDLGGARHRIEGALSGPGGTFVVRYVAPGASRDGAATWDIGEPPTLAPGPLPLPAMPLDEGSPHAGSVEDPLTGGPLRWSLSEASDATLTLAGRARHATRRDLRAGDVTLTAFVDDSGQLLRVDLPGGVTMELAEESR